MRLRIIQSDAPIPTRVTTTASHQRQFSLDVGVLTTFERSAERFISKDSRFLKTRYRFKKHDSGMWVQFSRNYPAGIPVFCSFIEDILSSRSLFHPFFDTFSFYLLFFCLGSQVWSLLTFQMFLAQLYRVQERFWKKNSRSRWKRVRSRQWPTSNGLLTTAKFQIPRRPIRSIVGSSATCAHARADFWSARYTSRIAQRKQKSVSKRCDSPFCSYLE